MWLLQLLVVLAGLRLGHQSLELNEALLEWIQDLGGGVEGVSFQSIPRMGTGVVSTRDLEPGTVITRTPLSTLINIEHALTSELFGALSEEMPQISNTNLKALFVAYERKRGEGRGGDKEEVDREREEGEKGEERNGEELEGTVAEKGGEGERSFWKPYLDALPDILHTTHFFTEEELEQLQTSMVKQFAEKQRTAARKAYEEFEHVAEASFPELRNLSLTDLQWGVSIWSSRAHNVRVRDSEGEWQLASCLVPLADMFNMAMSRKEVTVNCNTNEESTHFECHTVQSVPAGKQLLVDYSARPDMRHNGRLLMHYGFVVPGNPYDSVSIELPEISHDLPNYRDRQELAKNLPILKRPFMQLNRPTAAEPTINQLIQVLRLVLGSIPELQRASQLPSPFSEPLGPKSEQRVLKKGVDFIRGILASYPTTLQQDTHTLRSQSLSTNAQLAVILRMEEKAILTANMAHLLTLLGQADHRSRRHKTEL